MILLGTSGFSYKDWVGPVYPPDLPAYRHLPYIAERVDSIELNVTYYRIPERRIVAGWVERTPNGFLFSVKAHRSITHERESPDFDAYRQGISPLIEAERLACILAQFPYSFHPNPANRDYLRRIRAGFEDEPVVVEFRDRAWISDQTFSELEQLGMGFCCVDEPRLRGLIPPMARATSPVAYVRFHGRNAKQWWEHEHAWQRYDYSYSDEELQEWVPRIRELDSQAGLTLVYANNHYRGQSLETVKQLKGLLSADSG
jgi:uncharacterized protein YecE (DUF72 family)